MFASINRPGWRVGAVKQRARAGGGHPTIFRRNHHKLTGNAGAGTAMATHVLRRLDAFHPVERHMAATDGLSVGVDLGRLCLSCPARSAATEVLEGQFVGGRAEPERSHEARPSASS